MYKYEEEPKKQLKFLLKCLLFEWQFKRAREVVWAYLTDKRRLKMIYIWELNLQRQATKTWYSKVKK